MAYATSKRPLSLVCFLAVGLLGISAPLPTAAAEIRAQGGQQPSLPPGITRGATVEGITEYSLENGLRVLLFPDQSKQQITVNATYFVGSRHEAYGETGMAHLLEHLAFKGSDKHPDIPQEFSDRGALWNGTTWFDRTNYFETFPPTEDNLEWALDLEADRMVNSFIAADDLASEMTVVRNEWEAGENSPYNVLMKRTMSAAFQWHNYGNSTIGARSDIEHVPIGRLQAFYRKYYQPDNAMLVVAGRFEEGKALELIHDKFGSVPQPDRSGPYRLYETYTAEPVQDGERTVTLRRVGDTQFTMAVYHVPAGPHPDYPAVDVLAHVLGNVPSGRLYKALVESGMAANAGATDRQLREPGALMTFAELRTEDDVDTATETMIATIEGVVAEPPSGEEIERAKNELLKNIDLAFRQSRLIALFLSEWSSMGDWRLFFLHRDRLRDVTPEDVHRVAQAYLKPSNRTVGRFIPVDRKPVRAEMPATPNVAELVAGYEGGEEVAEGELFDPTPANVEARTVRAELSSGFKYALVPKQNRGETVIVSLNLRLGTEPTLRGQKTAGALAGGMLMRGTVRHTRQELEDEIDRLRTQMFVSGNVRTAGGFIQTTRENLPGALRLLGEILREPAFDAKEWELLKEQRLAQIERQMSEPPSRAFRAFSRHLNPWPQDHHRYTATLEEELESVKAATLEEARAFHARFYGADAGTLAIVGDSDRDEIQPILEEIFGRWSAAVAFERDPDAYRPVEPRSIELETPDKANAYLVAGSLVEMSQEHPDWPAVTLGNYMLGGNPASRLFNRIRQKEGLSYGVGSSVIAHPIDERGTFRLSGISAPENVDRVETAIREEIEKVLADGFTAEEIERAKGGYLEQRQIIRAQDRSLAGQLSQGLFFDRTLEWNADFERKIQELTRHQILEAMRRHIDPAKLVVVRAGEFARPVP
jgi:zinc protease